MSRNVALAMGFWALFVLGLSITACSESGGGNRSGGGRTGDAGDHTDGGGSAGTGANDKDGGAGSGGDSGADGGASGQGGQDGGNCSPITCQDYDAECGVIDDGCGGLVSCGGCEDGELCGGNGVPHRCGKCTETTCQSAGASCGPIGDGCGGVVNNCGNCQSPAICGGGGVPSVCGGGGGGGPGSGCVGLCEKQVFCPNDGATTLTGTVYAPNGVTPLYNVMVYVPVHPEVALPEIVDGAACDRCDSEELGAPLVSTLSQADGTFTLKHVPADVSFPLVIKAGKWRRVVTIPARTSCSSTALTPEQTRLPKNRSEGAIPRVAISTGQVDALECVLYKAGVDASEFTRPADNGRIHLYRANGSWPDSAIKSCNDCGTSITSTANDCRQAWCGGSDTAARTALLATVNAQRLYEAQAQLDGYDMIAFGCEAGEQTRAEADRLRLLSYANKGGRLFLSHFNYDWIRRGTSYATDPLHTTAVWGGLSGDGALSDPTAAFVDTSFPKGVAFSQWLDVTNASSSSGNIQIHEPRRYVQNTTAVSRRWIYTTQAAHGENSIQHYTFNTPVGAADPDVCGRVVYSAFHVATGNHGSAVFPNHCGGALSAQEKVLLFMLFDLAACVSDDDLPPVPPPTCQKRSCGSANADCGYLADGCGGLVNCGECDSGLDCIHNRCLSTCTPKSCQQANAECGSVADGCGAKLDCGECTPPETCGGLGIPNRCGSPQ